MKATQQADGIALAAQLEPLSAALIRAANRVTDGSPVTSTQRFVLVELVDCGPLRLGALAERIAVTAPTTSRAVDGLVSAGFVQRQVDPDDRRAVLHVATARGMRWVARRRAVVAEALDEALSRLSAAERKSLLVLLTRLNDELR